MHACCERLTRSRFLGGLGAAFTLAGCSSGSNSIMPLVPASEITVLTNGNIITLRTPVRAAAVAIRGGRILATAANGGTLEKKYPGAHLYDLGGATLAPGFIEAHAHISQTCARRPA